MCIISGNHSIRIINFNRNSCDVILKEGFNSLFIKNEINLRLNFLHPSIPKLIDHDISNGFYSEEIITGLPLNRLSNKSHKSFALENS